MPPARSYASPLLAWLHTFGECETQFSHSTRSVALALLTLSDQETGWTEPMSYKKVSEAAGCSRGTLVAALRNLEDAGLIRRLGAYEQVNTYILVVDNAVVVTPEPGPIFVPGQCPCSTGGASTEPESGLTPVQNLDHKRNSSPPSPPSSLPNNVVVLGDRPAVPLARSWQPTPQHQAAMTSLHLDRDAVVTDFFGWAGLDSDKPRNRSDWDKTFGWWINKPEGWKSYHEAVTNIDIEAAEQREEETPPVPEVQNLIDAPDIEEPEQPQFIPVARIMEVSAATRQTNLIMTTLASYGLGGASVRDRVVELLDSGTNKWLVARTVVEERGGEMDRANGIEAVLTA